VYVRTEEDIMEPVIDHINRYVSNVEGHISFYTRALGYELMDRGVKGDGSEYAILKGHGHEMFVSEKPDCHVEERALRHLGYAVEGIDELLEELKRNGLADRELNVIEKPYSRQLYIKDPDGNEIDLIQWTDKDRFYKDLKKKGDNP
jgi:catechol 2,3-dioxygenase-like lactoylglutathione lyase family enzyme